MIASGAIALAIGFNVEASPLLLLLLVFVYGLTVPADSGALTSGTTASAVAMHRGATFGDLAAGSGARVMRRGSGETDFGL
jgi:hypothetical protein